MGTIAENLLALQQTKQNFKTSFENKGVDLTDVPFTEYPNKLEELKENLDTELTEQETSLAKLEEDVNALSDKDDTALKILNGTLEEFDNTQWGLTSIERYKFYNFYNLGKVRLGEDIVEIGEYAFFKAGQDVENPDFEINLNNCTIRDYAFANSKVQKAKLTLDNFKQYTFYQCYNLTELNLTITHTSTSNISNGYSFMHCQNVEKFNLNPNSRLMGVSINMFYSLGELRPNPENNVFVFDLRKSTFSKIGSYAFYKSCYFDIFIPATCSTIENYAFTRSDHYNIYFTSITPATISSNTFIHSNAIYPSTAMKIFVPYNYINTYKVATNWVTASDMIYGWAEENTFEQGAMLPKYSAEGYELTWYSDKDMTTQVTSVEDASKIYYCTIGETQVEVVNVNSVVTYNSNVSIVDGNGIQYPKGYYVPVGTNLTITTSPTISGYTPYNQTLNEEEFTSPYTYTTVSGTNIDIVAIYWNGTDVPVNFDFAQNSWAMIKNIVQQGKAGDFWSVGDVKEIEVDGLTYGIRLADLQQGRYDYADGSRKTNAVFEFVQLYNTTYEMNEGSTNAGGWAESKLRTTLNTEILSKLPVELQSLLEEVVVASANTGSSDYEITTSNNYLFVPCGFEVALSTTYGRTGEGTTWDYYINSVNATRIKMRPNTTSAQGWWLRSPSPNNTTSFAYVNNNGVGYNYTARSNLAVCPCFAW